MHPLGSPFPPKKLMSYRAWRKNSFPSILGGRPEFTCNIRLEVWVFILVTIYTCLNRRQRQRERERCQPIWYNQDLSYKQPETGRPRGGELGAEDLALGGYHDVRVARLSEWCFVGDEDLETIFGDAAVEYPLGETPVDITFGVAPGVHCGVIYGLTEIFCLAAANKNGLNNNTVELNFKPVLNTATCIICTHRVELHHLYRHYYYLQWYSDLNLHLQIGSKNKIIKHMWKHPQLTVRKRKLHHHHRHYYHHYSPFSK